MTGRDAEAVVSDIVNIAHGITHVQLGALSTYVSCRCRAETQGGKFQPCAHSRWMSNSAHSPVDVKHISLTVDVRHCTHSPVDVKHSSLPGGCQTLLTHSGCQTLLTPRWMSNTAHSRWKSNTAHSRWMSNTVLTPGGRQTLLTPGGYQTLVTPRWMSNTVLTPRWMSNTVLTPRWMSNIVLTPRWVSNTPRWMSLSFCMTLRLTITPYHIKFGFERSVQKISSRQSRTQTH